MAVVLEFLEKLVELLQKGGPWTVTGICMVVAAYFHRELRTFQREAAKDKQALNDRLIGMTEKQVEVLTLSNENQKDLIEAVKLYKSPEA